MADIDLNFIAQQNDRLISDMGQLRDDMRVLTAIVIRQDATLSAVLSELRAVHQQISRINDRVHRLEDAATRG